MRLLQYLVVCMIAGCGDAFVTELQTTDARIRITIRDPSDCDESRYVYGIVKGLSQNQPPQRIGLRNVACGNQINADLFVLLEGMNWCAVANADVIAQNPPQPLDAVSLIVERDVGKIHFTDGSKFFGCPAAIRESVLTAVKTFRPMNE